MIQKYQLTALPGLRIGYCLNAYLPYAIVPLRHGVFLTLSAFFAVPFARAGSMAAIFAGQPLGSAGVTVSTDKAGTELF